MIAHIPLGYLPEETDLTYEGIETWRWSPPYFLVPGEETDLTYEGIETRPPGGRRWSPP